jgi:hypothetical protein
MQHTGGMIANQMTGLMTAKQREDAMRAMQNQAQATAGMVPTDAPMTPKDDVMSSMQSLVYQTEELLALASSKLDPVMPPVTDKLNYADSPKDTSEYPPLYSAMISMLRSIAGNIDATRSVLLRAVI